MNSAQSKSISKQPIKLINVKDTNRIRQYNLEGRYFRKMQVSFTFETVKILSDNGIDGKLAIFFMFHLVIVLYIL